MKKNKIIFMLLTGILVFTTGMPVFALTSDLQYQYKKESNSEFYKSGMENLNYNGEVPDYLKDIYDLTPQPVYNSNFGATIIEPPNNATIPNEAIQNAPQNAPVRPSADNQPIKTNSYGVSPIEGKQNSEKPVTLPSDSVYQNYYPNNFDNVKDEKKQYLLTSVENVRKSNGEIGTLKITAINLTVKAYDGDTFSAMKKGIGHISSTSAWSGNIGLVGHNRGNSNYFGNLKKLSLGDEITYTTILGSRKYVVEYIGKIADTDWSRLQYTNRHKLTLITCVENSPTQRLCVQAIEKQ